MGALDCGVGRDAERVDEISMIWRQCSEDDLEISVFKRKMVREVGGLGISEWNDCQDFAVPSGSVLTSSCLRSTRRAGSLCDTWNSMKRALHCLR
jgi:hypothetical protein